VASLNRPGSNVTVAGNLRTVAALICLARIKREENVLLDRFGRLLCPTCLEPMTQAAAFDQQQGDSVKAAFECRSCAAVIMLTGRLAPATSQDQLAA
jgi:hypothetical protein